MDEADQREDLADLVPLEVADHVPADLLGEAGGAAGGELVMPLEELLDLSDPLGELLDAVFGQIDVSQLNELAYLVHGGVFGDGDENNVLGPAASAGGG